MFLLIDTCTDKGWIAVTRGDSILYLQRLAPSYKSAQELIPALHKALEENKITWDAVEAIGVTNGPGSYTGLRVGVVTAKTLAFALNKPVIGISSLAVYEPKENGDFIALLDAKMGGLYGQKGTKNETGTTFSSPFACSIEEFVAQYHAEKLVSPMSEELKVRLPFAVENVESSPLLMANQVQAQLLSDNTHHFDNLPIQYMRRTQAEIELESKRKV